MEPSTAATKRIKSVSKANAYRREVEWALADLGEPELRVARDFLEFLHTRSADTATLEVLGNPVLMRDIHEAQSDLRQGRSRRFVARKTIRRNV